MKTFLVLCVLCVLCVRPAHAASPNDIRFQQFDGLQWNWVEVRPINAGALTFDGSLQFAVESAKQPLLSATSNVTVSNVVASGYITLSGLTNRITVAAGAAKVDGAALALQSAVDAKQATLTATTSLVGTNANIGNTINATNGFQRGAFTGITTTNTFYSVAANLLSTITNVVVVQGGIITGWTVTP
jgi:hypothetical protein